jgi:hypothetical protein
MYSLMKSCKSHLSQISVHFSPNKNATELFRVCSCIFVVVVVVVVVVFIDD